LVIRDIFTVHINKFTTFSKERFCAILLTKSINTSSSGTVITIQAIGILTSGGNILITGICALRNLAKFTFVAGFIFANTAAIDWLRYV